MPLELLSHPIDFAKELSLELELRSETPSYDEIKDTVVLMNKYLWGVKGDIAATLHATEAYLDIPETPEDIEFYPDSSLSASKVEKAIVTGKIDSFRWLGSTGISAFGIQMFGVRLYAPVAKHSNNAFIPVEGIGTQFAV